MHRLFPSQQPDEHIHLVVREDVIRLALRLLIWGLLVVALVIFYRYAPTAFFMGQLGTVTALAVRVYSLLVIASLFLIFVLYYLNIHIVTNLRIVDVDQVNLFHHTTSELSLANVEDVTSETKGLLGTIFDFGTVYIQTAGARERFAFENVPRPREVAKVIVELYRKQPRAQQGHRAPATQ
jgi:hypothetical protein